MENIGGYFVGALVAWFSFLLSVILIDAWLGGFISEKIKRWLNDLQSND